MKVAHLSDLHLGHAGSGLGSGRARDVARVFGEAVEQIGELAPALVVVSGDVFDHAQVGAPAIAVFARAVKDLADGVPGIVVAVAAGVRDTSVGVRQAGPLDVVAELDRVEVAVTGVRRFRLEEHDASVTLAPHAAWVGDRGGAFVAEPESHAKWNVLAAYVDLAGRRDDRTGGVRPQGWDEDGHRRPRLELGGVRAQGWDYVALGSRHARTQVAERVHYSGSLERIGPDPWREAANDKGFVVADLESGATTFRPVRARAVVSLAPVDAGRGGAVAVGRRLSEALASVPGGIEGKLVRVPVRGLDPDDFAALDRDALAPLRQRAAGLRVDALPAPGRGRGTRSLEAREERREATPEARRTDGVVQRALKSGRGEGRGTPSEARLGPAARRAKAFEASSGEGSSAAASLRDLQLQGLGGPAADLQGAIGLVALVGDAESRWEAVAGNVRVAFGDAGAQAGAPGDRGGRRSGSAAWPGADLGPLVHAALEADGLGRAEYAAVWFGGGSVETWLSAGAALLRDRAHETGVAAEPETAVREPGRGAERGRREALADWCRKLLRETEADVVRLERTQRGTDELKNRLARLREDVAEAHGDLEAATMGWVRERQDAETRLLLHRDRASELKKRLKELEEPEPEATGADDGAAKGRATKAGKARRDEWDSVVQDGQWWRRRREQLEDKPPEIKAAEKRALEIEAEVEAVSEEVERRRVQAQELQYARRRLRDLRETASRITPSAGSSSPGQAASAAAQRFRERVHAETVTLTGGRLGAAFPELFAAWTAGRLRSGGDVAALELAARIALAELGVEAGLPLASALLPRALRLLRADDVARALARLAELARRVPLVMVGATRAIVAAHPESVDFLIVGADDDLAAGRPPMARPRPAGARLL